MPGLDKRRILQGSASNLTRVILGMLISLVLPHFLVHHMGTAEYSAWVLILQLSAYVNFLDLGLQTAIGKFVAEYQAAGNASAARKTVSNAFTVMLGAALLGALAIFGMVWQVPRIFAQMPGALVGVIVIRERKYDALSTSMSEPSPPCSTASRSAAGTSM